jgi:poly-gamma-glutamate synthesis protein (capsule biosynthesis protein)
MGGATGAVAAAPFARSQDSLIMGDPVRIAFAGDCVLARPWTSADEASGIRALLEAQAVFCNVETLFHDFEWPPMASSGGLYMQSSPDVATTLQHLNVRLASVANNHAADYGPHALLHSREVLESAGIRCSGAGGTLTQARDPAVLEIDGTRVALISATSTFPEHARAADGSTCISGRPGVSTLRFASLIAVTEERFAVLEDAFTGVAVRPKGSDNTLLLPFASVVVADEAGLVTLPHPIDLLGLAAVVQQAADEYDVVIVSLHSHERDRRAEGPAGFLRAAARRLVEAGAAVIACHGTHAAGGIEVHRGAPILYGLGNFFFEIEHVEALPPDAYLSVGLPSSASPAEYLRQRGAVGGSDLFASHEYWQSLVAAVDFREGRAIAVELRPFDLGLWTSDGRRGRPRLADPEVARSVIDAVRNGSAGYGTEILGEQLGHVVLP